MQIALGTICIIFSAMKNIPEYEEWEKGKKNKKIAPNSGIFSENRRITNRDRSQKTSVNTDKEIIEAVKGGGSKGQSLMVSRYGQQVFAMVVRQVGDAMDAEELTQDTFLRAFSHISSYDPQRASLGTWLCRIAYRLTLDFLKRRRPQIVSIEDTEVWQTDISEEQLAAGLSTGSEERIRQLELLMDDLPPDDRLLLTLYYFENRPLNECAFIIDTTAHALANRLYRIRRKLFKQLQTYDKP